MQKKVEDIMEKFYIVSAESTLGEDYQNYKNDSDLLYKTYLDFAKEKGIVSDGVYLTAKRLWINPTTEDKEKFSTEFMMYEPGKFKKTSPLCKEWINLCKIKGIKGLSKPRLVFYFNLDVLCGCRGRLFDLDGTIYCSFESNSGFSAPDGLTEIKASKFYQIMEQQNVQV